MAAVAALALAASGCKHTPEEGQATSTQPATAPAPEAQPAPAPQANAMPSTTASTPTETAPTQSASAEREPCNPGAAPARYADANNDGKVTKEEAQADPNLVAVFDQYDANHDGVLDHDEFQKIVDDSQQKHPDRAEFAKAEATSEPCPDQQQKKDTEPGT